MNDTGTSTTLKPSTALTDIDRRLLREALQSVTTAIHGAYDDLSGEDLSRLARAQENIARVLAEGAGS